MNPQRKGAGEKTHTHSHRLFVSGSCVCVCVCPQNHCFGGSVFLQPPKYISFPRKKNSLSLCLCVCLSLSLSHTERRELCVHVDISRKSLSEMSQLLASRKKDVLLPQRKKKYSQHTRVRTHTHTQKCDSPLCLYYLENEQTNKQTFCFSAHRKLYVCLSLGKKKKKVSISTLKSHFLKITGQKCILPHKDHSR